MIIVVVWRTSNFLPYSKILSLISLAFCISIFPGDKLKFYLIVYTLGCHLFSNLWGETSLKLNRHSQWALKHNHHTEKFATSYLSLAWYMRFGGNYLFGGFANDIFSSHLHFSFTVNKYLLKETSKKKYFSPIIDLRWLCLVWVAVFQFPKLDH